MTAALEVRSISFAYRGGSGRAPHPVLHDFSLRLAADETLVVTGPSGCGKSTLLRVAASMLIPDAGTVLSAGTPVSAPDPGRLLLFQDDSQLLPWKPALDYLVFWLRMEGMNRAEARERGRAALREVGLEQAADRYPHQMSGGMRQRLALARIIAGERTSVLLDEPFASVDRPTRRRLADLLLRLRAQSCPAALVVTHDSEEALTLAQRIVVMGRDGSLIADIANDGSAPRLLREALDAADRSSGHQPT